MVSHVYLLSLLGILVGLGFVSSNFTCYDCTGTTVTGTNTCVNVSSETNTKKNCEGCSWAMGVVANPLKDITVAVRKCIPLNNPVPATCKNEELSVAGYSPTGKVCYCKEDLCNDEFSVSGSTRIMASVSLSLALLALLPLAWYI